jgi:hypothetical protein
MAFTPNSSLKANPEILLRDQRHAARIFADDQFRLAPKHKFLFHVAFGLNKAALKVIDINERHGSEIGMLVKSVSLPKFTISAETANQYNRKKVVQYTHKFEDSTIKFHDDNMGLINSLWQNYYTYYYADPTSAQNTSAYNRNATKGYDYVKNNTYGLDNGSTTPFFTYIKFYQMARHEYVSYTLHNPIIKSWDHAQVSYEEKSLHDNTMTVGFEAVSYGRGEVTAGDPIGFGMEHYDTTPSPLQPLGNSFSSSPNFLNSGNITNNATNFLTNLIATNNAYQNNQVSNTGDNAGIVTTPANPTTGGIQDTAFPTSNSNTNTTTASNSTVGT